MQTPVMFIKNPMMQLIKLDEYKEHLETNMYKIMYSQLVIVCSCGSVVRALR